MTLPLLLAASLLAPALASDSPSADPWLRSAGAGDYVDTSDQLLWTGDWQQLDLVSTMVFAAGGIAALSASDGTVFTVTLGSLVGTEDQHVCSIQPGRVELLTRTGRGRVPWCVVALQLETGEPQRDRLDRVVARGETHTMRDTVICAPTPLQALQEAADKASDSLGR